MGRDAREVSLPENDFYVAKDGKLEGPISKQNIQEKLEQSALSYTDYVWLSNSQEWTMLANFFAAKFPPPIDPPPGITVATKPMKEFSSEEFSGNLGISNEPIWFVYREKNKFGPYRYLDLVRLLQQNNCSPDDFVWKPSMSDWQRIRQTPEFSEDVLKKMASMKAFSVEKVFLKRRFPRIPYDAEVILHDEHRVQFGSAKSLSEGGAFIALEKLGHSKGDRLKLHFTIGDLGDPFNCIAEITQVSKKPPQGYNVKFIYLEDGDRKRISKYAKGKADEDRDE